MAIQVFAIGTDYLLTNGCIMIKCIEMLDEVTAEL